MNRIAWLLILGGAGLWAWKKFMPATAGGDATPSPDTAASTNYIFHGQVGSNFVDASNNQIGEGGSTWRFESAFGPFGKFTNTETGEVVNGTVSNLPAGATVVP